MYFAATHVTRSLNGDSMFPSRKARSPRPAPALDSVSALYRTHGSWVVAFLARRFGRDLAEDLAQETFLRLAAQPVDWKHPKALLARIAINVALDHLRREQAQKRPRLVAAEDYPEPSTPPDQHEALLHREVVAKLPRNLRDVYVLSRFAGMTYPEIAERLGLSVKAVEKRMTQALRLCVARYRA
jgi:RNA polymerase sigma factor (sigma-70 family)